MARLPYTAHVATTVCSAVLVCGLAGAAWADAGDNHVSADLAENIGVLSATHTMLTAGYARRIAGDRGYVEARLGAGTTGSLLVLEGRGGIGLVFAPSPRVDLLVGWRLGDSYFRGSIGDAPYAVHMLAIEVVVQLAIALDRDWRLRAVPLAPTLFWNRTYGGALGVELGIDHAF